MNAVEMNRRNAPPQAADEDPARVLEAGVLAISEEGAVRFADGRALALLGVANGFELERLWAGLRSRLEEAGLKWQGPQGEASRAAIALPVPGEAEPGVEASEATGPAERRLAFDLRRDAAGGGVLLLQEIEVGEARNADLRLVSQMRSVAQISPSVAHDLRAPINAMVFNIEILKETIASGRGAEPGGRERQLRYVNVLKEELTRLHKSLEIFLSFISPRGDRDETFDFRELAEELAALLVAPARKQQVQVAPEQPEGKIQVVGNRYYLRQALLHLALAALEGVPRQGTLVVRLERQDRRARLRIFGRPGPDSPPAEAASEPQGFDVRPTAGGTLAGLWVTREIFAAYGGEARAVGPSGAETGALQAYEVELTISEDLGSENKE
jgi:signal transduction histidine kinase